MDNRFEFEPDEKNIEETVVEPEGETIGRTQKIKDFLYGPISKYVVVGGAVLLALYKTVFSPIDQLTTKVSDLEKKINTPKEKTEQLYTPPQNNTIEPIAKQDTSTGPVSDPDEPYKTKSLTEYKLLIEKNQSVMDSLETTLDGGKPELDFKDLKLLKNIDHEDLVLRVGITDGRNIPLIYHIDRNGKVKVSKTIAGNKEGATNFDSDVGVIYVGFLGKDKRFHIVASRYV